MRVMAAGRRVAIVPGARPQSRHRTFPAPTRGWVTAENLATSRGQAALVLDNWIPTQTGIRARGGTTQYADIGSTTVTHVAAFQVGGLSKLFASDVDEIYDITSTPTAVVTGQTSGDYSTQIVEVAGGNYMYWVNGEDSPRLYDGASTWTAVTGVSTPAITGSVSDTSTLTHVWLYRNRLYFVQSGTQTAHYLSTDVIGGSATQITMRGVFQRGGTLLFGATWTIDSGDGIDDRCVFVSSLGEVAVYGGSYPGGSDWSLQGRYDLAGAPLGKNAYVRVGGDLLIATTEGLVPLSAVVSKDPAQLSLAAVSAPIEPSWRVAVVDRENVAWPVAKWVAQNMIVIGLPDTGNTTASEVYVVNIETGAWARWTGIDMRSAAVYNDALYFGTSSGLICVAESGGSDLGTPYTCAYAGHFEHLGAIGQFVTPKLARATFRYAGSFNHQLSVSSNYAQAFPTPPNSVANYTIDLWDAGEWDEAIWDASIVSQTQIRWNSIVGPGISHSPQVQITCGVTPAPQVELVVLDIVFETGGLVV